VPRSILTIDVDDTKFKQYLELFKSYQDELSKTGTIWREAGEAASGAESASVGMVDTLAASAASTVLIADAMNRTESASTRAVSSMGRIADHAKSAAGYIVGAAESLAKWATLSLGAGLVGGGVGLWGLDRLGESVAATRRTSMGLGISAGELQAFNVNYGARLGLGTGFLEQIQGASSDYSRAGVFAQMGIPWTQVQGENTAELSTDVIRRAHALWQSAGPGGHTIQGMQANGLAALGMDLQTWQTIGRQSPGDLERWGQQYRHDVGSMNPSDPTQKAWTDFVTQLDRAGKQIETVFVKALQPLIDSGALPKLSGAVEHLVEKFFANDNVIKWVDEFAKAINSFGDYLGSAKFQNDMKTLVDEMAYAVDKMAGVLRFLGLLPATPAPGLAIADHPMMSVNATTLPGIGKSSLSSLFDFSPGGWADFDPLEKATGLPHGLLYGLGMQESGMRVHPNDTYDAGEWHKGMFQMSDSMRQRLGITDPYSADQVSKGAALEERSYLQRFHGNIAKAIAAWNEGPGAVERQEQEAARTGRDWLSYASPGVQKYVRDVADKAHVTLTVNVQNQTGANVAVTANSVR
jgi:hypothetical protein